MKVKLNETIKGIDRQPLTNPNLKRRGGYLMLWDFCN